MRRICALLNSMGIWGTRGLSGECNRRSKSRRECEPERGGDEPRCPDSSSPNKLYWGEAVFVTSTVAPIPNVPLPNLSSLSPFSFSEYVSPSTLSVSSLSHSTLSLPLAFVSLCLSRFLSVCISLCLCLFVVCLSICLSHSLSLSHTHTHTHTIVISFDVNFCFQFKIPDYFA